MWLWFSFRVLPWLEKIMPRDPLPPYPFVLVMEILRAVEDSLLSSFKVVGVRRGGQALEISLAFYC